MTSATSSGSVSPATRRHRKGKFRGRRILAEISMIAIGLAFAFPFYVFLVVALKPPAEVASNPLGLPRQPYFQNFVTAWERGEIARAMYNSIVIAGISTLALVVLGSLAAYVIARRTTRLSNVAYLLFLLGLMVPVTLGMTPLYQLMRDWNLLQTYTSVILFSVATQLPITIFLYAGFLRAIPREYDEAAYVDGAGPLRAFISVVFPMLRPVTGTVVILAAINIWNDFLTPLLYLGGSRYETLPVAISRFQGEFSTNWGVVFAGMSIAIMPILIGYFALQKHIIKGFASGLKG